MARIPVGSSIDAQRTRLPASEALRIAAQLTDTEEDLHAITRVVLALVGEDDDLTGADADAALERAAIPGDVRRLLMAALGPSAGRPTVAELRTALDRAVAGSPEPAAGSTSFGRMIAELRRRRVMRTAFWYVGGSVALVEAASLFVPMLGGAEAIVRLLAILAVCGLPLALTLSWVFDLTTETRTALSRRMRFGLLGGVAATSVLAALTIWNQTSADGSAPALLAPGPAGPDPAHIAVLEFSAIGGDAELQAFAQQLQTRLIDGLSAAAVINAEADGRTLRVLSHAGVLPFGRSEYAVDSLRTARRVGTVLQGSVEQSADRVRVRFRLVDTQTGYQIHTSSADHPAGERIALLDAVADSVIRLVRQQLGPVVKNRMLLLETRSQAAFDRLVWAQHRLADFSPALARMDFEAAEHVLIDADSMLLDAERLDPLWIEPIIVRGRQSRRWVLLANVRRDTPAIVPAIRRGIAHTQRALALNPADSRALELRGELLQYQLQTAPPTDAAEGERLRSAAEHDLRASLLGHHAPANALRALSELSAYGGNMAEALVYGKRALERDPFMTNVELTMFRLFEYSLALGRDSTAAGWCQTGRQRFPDLPIFHDCRLTLGAWARGYALSVDSAWALVAAELAAYPLPLRPTLEPRLLAMVAAVIVRLPADDSTRALLQDSARALMREVRRRDDTPGVLRAAVGVHGLLGEADSARAVLRALLDDATVPRRALLTAPELRMALEDRDTRALLDVRPASIGRRD